MPQTIDLPMPSTYSYDVFISHSSKDKPAARELAHQLRQDNLRVWFDEWNIRPGDNIPGKIEEGLENSRILLFLMSEHSLNSDWAQLEYNTQRFRDPMNRDRRFIPLRLDEAPIKAALKPFLYISWLPDDRKREYPRLLEACTPTPTPAPPKNSNPTPQKNLGTAPSVRTAFSLGHAGIIYAVAISPDSRHSLSASGDGLVRLWDNLSGHCLKVFEGHTGGVLCVQISHDGLHALSGSEDKTIRLWNISTGECEQVFTGHPDPITTVAFSPDDRQIISVSTRTEDPKNADPASDPTADPASAFDTSLQTLRIWDRNPAKMLYERTTPSTYDERIDISPDTKYAFFIPKDDYVPHVFEISNVGVVSAFRELGGDEENAVQTCHAWSPDSHRILSGLNTGLIQLWNAKTGKLIRNLTGHSVEVNAIAFSPNGRYAISAADNQELRIWDISTGHSLHSMEGHEERIAAVAWAPNNRFALSGAFDHQLFQWDTTDGSLIEIFEGHTSYWINNVQWNKDCRLALSCASDKTIRLWDTQTGYQLHTFEGHTDLTRMAVWNPTNDQAASISKDGTIRIWEVMTGRLLHNFPPYTPAKIALIPNCIAWSPDGTKLVIGFDNGGMVLRPVQSPNTTYGVPSHDAEVSDIAWSPDGRYFASASHDNTARISSSEGITLQIFKGPDNRIQCLSWSPDSEYLACGYIDDSSVRIWERSTGRCLSILKGHFGGVWRVAWSPDGRYILSGSEDYTLRIWEVNTRSCIRVLEGNTDHVVGINWSPDMNTVYSATANGVCAKWTL